MVVDNDADEGTRAVLRRWAGLVEVVRTGANLGFAGGVQAASALVRSPLVLLLNDDAELRPRAVEEMVATLELEGESCAAVQPTVLLAGSSPQLVHTTGTMLTPDGFGYDRDWLQPWSRPRDGGDPPFGFCGAAALLRMDALRRAGGMDGSLFLYYEDTDLSWRLRLAGYRVAFCPSAVVDHQHSASAGEGSDVALFHSERNRLLVLARNASWPLAVGQWLRYPVTTASWAFRTPAVSARTSLRIRALASAARRLPRALSARRRPRPVVRRRGLEQRWGRPAGTLESYRT